MLASTKLKKALIELEDLKRAKVHDNLGLLYEASQKVSKTSWGVYPPILRQIGQIFVFSKF